MTRRVVIEARAKLNLGLAVGPRRRDGYHELATCFQSVSLSDTLTASRARRGFSLRVSGQPALGQVPSGSRNLV
ncbi:MAG: 4-(cytidine 5'-diphospho)-2-C-methyl-D-erythritol kinase, partial [Candidatus Eiseniibacteriota bacterium]